MLFRKTDTTRNDVLASCLRSEGIEESEHGYEHGETWICERDGTFAGFFTVELPKFRIGIPRVIHFYVAPAFRGGSVFRELAYGVKRLFKERGYRYMTVAALESKPRVREFVERYGRTKPYGVSDGQFNYLVGV